MTRTAGGSLTAQNLENISRWQLESAGFQGSFGGAGQGDAHSWLGQVGQGMAANSMSLLGGGRDHNERTVSHSAVSDNITINTTSISGDLSRDVAHANGALDNKFDAQKLQNQMQANQLGTQLVGEVMGRVSDELFSHGVPGFDERSATNNWARALLEAGGNAAVATGTGGNVGAAAASVFAGTIVSGATRNWADSMATALTGQSSGGHGSQHDSLMNLLSNGIASAAGAAGGLVAGPGNATANALNGATAASAIQQYNQAFEPPEREDIREVRGERNAETGELLSDVDVFNIETYKNNIKEIEDIDPGNPLLSRTQLVPPGTVHVPTDEEINEVVSAAELARYTLRENNNDKEATRIELGRIRQEITRIRHEQSGKGIYQSPFPELDPPIFENLEANKPILNQDGVLNPDLFKLDPPSKEEVSETNPKEQDYVSLSKKPHFRTTVPKNGNLVFRDWGGNYRSVRNNFRDIGATIEEFHMNNSEPGIAQMRFETDDGKVRYVDYMSDASWAFELKGGHVVGRRSVFGQIAKDVQLRNEGKIKGATWIFYESPVNGGLGASPSVIRVLQENGIGIEYRPLPK